MSDTRTDLVEELEHLLAHAKPGARKVAEVKRIIEMAKRGDFHDYKSQHEAACPKVLLVGMLREASLPTIATRVIDGEFDEEADAEDCAELALALKDEPELRELLKLPKPVKA